MSRRLHYRLSALAPAPEALDDAIVQWTGQHGAVRAPLAMDN